MMMLVYMSNQQLNMKFLFTHSSISNHTLHTHTHTQTSTHNHTQSCTLTRPSSLIYPSIVVATYVKIKLLLFSMRVLCS